MNTKNRQIKKSDDIFNVKLKFFFCNNDFTILRNPVNLHAILEFNTALHVRNSWHPADNFSINIFQLNLYK